MLGVKVEVKFVVNTCGRRYAFDAGALFGYAGNPD
jgi:hypothetical protein